MNPTKHPLLWDSRVYGRARVLGTVELHNSVAAQNALIFGYSCASVSTLKGSTVSYGDSALLSVALSQYRLSEASEVFNNVPSFDSCTILGGTWFNQDVEGRSWLAPGIELFEDGVY